MDSLVLFMSVFSVMSFMSIISLCHICKLCHLCQLCHYSIDFYLSGSLGLKSFFSFVFENDRIHISVCCVVLWYNKSVVIQKKTPQALKKEGLLSETGLFQNCWKQFLRSPRGQLLALLVTTFAALLFRLLLGSF